MNPRMKSSKKWTKFPKEYSDQILSVFQDNFGIQLEDSSIHIEGRIYQEEVMLRVGIRKNGQLRQANFEVSMNYSQDEQDAIERIHNCVDAAASMVMEYIEKEGEVDFPLTWQEYPFQSRKIYLQFTTENSDLESEANKILGISEAMYNEDEESEDALARADEHIEHEDLHDHDGDENDYVSEEKTEDEEDAEPGQPRMFGGLPKPPKKKKEDMH